MICQCGKEAKYIEFLTFSYYYCPHCKKEVSVEDVERSLLSEFERMLNEGSEEWHRKLKGR